VLLPNPFYNNNHQIVQTPGYVVIPIHRNAGVALAKRNQKVVEMSERQGIPPR
jgi:hypothetical protein